jgi:putative inorganic carbon (HCO3(-)) transporter
MAPSRPDFSRLPVPLLHAGLVLLIVPPLAQPFSLPKLVLLLGGAAALGLLALRPGTPPPRVALLLVCGWLGLLSLSALLNPAPSPQALLLDGGAALLLLALLSVPLDEPFLLRALSTLGAALATIVLLQALLPGSRMRLFGTLGNPDFCAGWLGAAACLTAAQRRFKLLALQVAALAALGSFATLLALGAGGMAAALVLRQARPLVLLVPVLCVLALSVRRDPLTVLEGRVELHRVALSHLAEAPLLGHGPGSVRALWPSWQPAAPAQEHVHDDWLERALEQGLPAALLLAGLLALALLRAGAHRAGAAAGLASIAARALVDFPLARPAELALFVTLIAVCLRRPACPDSP